tara:strand:- start:106 stop:273 length:168 start_codon:yes stop_codon:yes gene_type:complete
MTNREHLKNCADIIGTPTDPELEQCYNCDRDYKYIEVPSGWDEDFCRECNEENSK